MNAQQQSEIYDSSTSLATATIGSREGTIASSQPKTIDDLAKLPRAIERLRLVRESRATLDPFGRVLAVASTAMFDRIAKNFVETRSQLMQAFVDGKPLPKGVSSTPVLKSDLEAESFPPRV